jgi:hypothetical protein
MPVFPRLEFHRLGMPGAVLISALAALLVLTLLGAHLLAQAPRGAAVVGTTRRGAPLAPAAHEVSVERVQFSAVRITERPVARSESRRAEEDLDLSTEALEPASGSGEGATDAPPAKDEAPEPAAAPAAPGTSRRPRPSAAPPAPDPAPAGPAAGAAPDSSPPDAPRPEIAAEPARPETTADPPTGTDRVPSRSPFAEPSGSQPAAVEPPESEPGDAVEVRVEVGPQGRARSVVVTRSSGDARRDARAVQQALRRRYRIPRRSPAVEILSLSADAPEREPDGG